MANLFSSRAEIHDGLLLRRAGLFYREKIRIADIRRIVAVLKDSMTHEEIVIVFFDGTGPRVWLSEFDLNCQEVMRELEAVLPGLTSYKGLVAEKAFAGAQQVLWEA